jgi:hypothetical protein
MPNRIPQKLDDVGDDRSSSTGSTRQEQEAEVNPHSPEREIVNQNPGFRQKRNQGDSKDDPLAA